MIVVHPPGTKVNLPGEFDVPGKKLLVAFNLSPEVTSIDRVVSAVLAHPDADAVLIWSVGEPSEYNYIHSVRHILKKSFGIKHVAIIDSGIDNGSVGDMVMIPDELLFCLVAESQPVVPPEGRQYHYSFLNRIARVHRIKLVLELEKRGLLGLGAVSCGSSGEVYDFSVTVPDDKLHLFPMHIDDIAHTINGPVSERGTGLKQYVADITDQQLSSVVNIVSESSFEHLIGRNECWTRPMYTEKTSKCYLGYQFPVFFTTNGYVQYNRNLGFDVFDDIIDHRYDNVQDPFRRIEMVADEVQRLVSRPLPELQQLVKDNWHRLEANARHVDNARAQVAGLAKVVWQQWMEAIKNS